MVLYQSGPVMSCNSATSSANNASVVLMVRSRHVGYGSCCVIVDFLAGCAIDTCCLPWMY